MIHAILAVVAAILAAPGLVPERAGAEEGPAAVDRTWTPPDAPDPRAILNEAQKDVTEGRHAVALAKLLWFHHHALEIDQSFYGVRLSFALSSWDELAKAYPPALTAMKRTRDDALAQFRRTPDSQRGYHAFHDFEALNEHLGEEDRTVAEFVALDAKKPDVAKSVFNVARPCLVRASEYSLYGKYVDPATDWLRAAEMYQLNKGMEGRFGPEHKAFAESSFTHEVATLLAILVVNGRREEAEKIAQKARLEWDDPGFSAAIDHALAGNVPAPWP